MPWKYFICINLYLLVTISYTLYFKDLPVIELIVLTLGFLLRPLGGAVGVDLPVSKWFLIVVGFGALFIGATKRLAEFLKSSERLVRAVLDEYTEGFLQSLINVSMAITLMGYALWVFEIQKGGMWSEVSLLPVTLGAFRYTWHRERGEAEAPETLIFQDPVLLFSGLAGLVTLSLAIYGK
jgi:decaprenyl-phosphate phosphoribosyltransferase